MIKKKNYASYFQNIYVALRISSWKLATEKTKNRKKIEKSGEEEKVDEEVWAQKTQWDSKFAFDRMPEQAIQVFLKEINSSFLTKTRK